MSDFSADNRATTNDAPRSPGSSTPTSPSPSPFGPLSASRSESPADSGPAPAPTPSQPFVRDPAPAPVVGPTANGTEAPAPSPAPSSSQPDTGEQRMLAEVKGRIEVADEVVEKVAALAAMEVPGVADLGGDFERALESVRERVGLGNKRGDQGVRAKITGREVAISITIMIQYGHVVMDVARNVKNNVALQANRMLGLRVVEVNVKVDDVRMPQETESDEDTDGGLRSIEG
jgi:uncharacterized alkaline shock family protein YloU